MHGLDHEGFAVLPNILDPTTIATLTRALNDASIPRSRAGIRNALQVDAVRRLAHDIRLLQITRATLGHCAFPFRATLFDKSPRSNWLVVWHQDTALPLCERRDAPGWGPWSTKEGITCAHAPAHALEQVLALRVHLDDSTEQNGPLRVLPATHGMGVLTDDAIQELARTVEVVTCCVRSGGVLAMRPLIVHASSKAKSDAAPRRVLHIEYASSSDMGNGVQLQTC